jgi:hypothetical protein
MDSKMTELLGSLSIYRRGQDPRLLLMHYAPLFDEMESYMGDGCWGDLHSIDLERFKREGLAIVQKSLSDYKTRKRKFGGADKQGFDLWPSSKRQRFFKEHADVGISQRENGDLWLDPTIPDIRTLSGTSDEGLRIIIPANAGSAEFFARLVDALKLSRPMVG